MTSLRGRFITGTTNMRRRPSDWMATRPPAIEFEERVTGAVRHGEYTYQQEYTVSLRVYANFWANSAQAEKCREIAEISLVNTLYADAISRLHHIANLISSGDQHEALEAVMNLKQELQAP